MCFTAIIVQLKNQIKSVHFMFLIKLQPLWRITAAKKQSAEVVNAQKFKQIDIQTKTKKSDEKHFDWRIYDFLSSFLWNRNE